MGHMTLLGCGKPPTIAGGAFTPASITSATLTYWGEARASNFQLITGATAASANSDPVGYLTDLSGLGNHFKAFANDATRPLLQGVGVNPYLDFDGTDDLLVYLTSLGLFANGSASVFVAWRPQPTGSNKVFFEEARSTNAAPLYTMIVEGGAVTTVLTHFARDDANTTFFTFGGTFSTTITTGTEQVYGYIDTGTAQQAYVNQTAQAANSQSHVGHTLTIDQCSLGGRNFNGVKQDWYAARLYGIVVCKGALSSTDRGNLTTYLGALAGLTI